MLGRVRSVLRHNQGRRQGATPGRASRGAMPIGYIRRWLRGKGGGRRANGDDMDHERRRDSPARPAAPRHGRRATCRRASGGCLSGWRSGSRSRATSTASSRQQLTFGERLADRVAEIGGSWSFIIGFGVFIVVWVLVNSALLAGFGGGFRSLSLHLPEPDPFASRRHPGAGHHDVAEPSGGEGPARRGARLRGELEVGDRDCGAARKARPDPHPRTGAAAWSGSKRRLREGTA